MSKITVLLTAAGSPGFPGHCYSLRKAYGKNIQIIGCDMNKDVYGTLLADHFRIVPPANDSDYLASIDAICKTHDVDAIFPLSDHELLPLTEHRNFLQRTEEHCRFRERQNHWISSDFGRDNCGDIVWEARNGI